MTELPSAAILILFVALLGALAWALLLLGRAWKLLRAQEQEAARRQRRDAAKN